MVLAMAMAKKRPFEAEANSVVHSRNTSHKIQRNTYQRQASKVNNLGRRLARYALEGNEVGTRRMLEMGAKVNEMRTVQGGNLIDTPYDESMRCGTTALINASKGGHEKVIRLVLEYGAWVNYPDNFCKNTPLMWASQEGHVKAVGKPGSGAFDRRLWQCLPECCC